jgi:energy-coupling factor transporter ATP-binding protein EcfA2
MSYDKFYAAKTLPKATYVFTDFDRLALWELRLAAALVRNCIGPFLNGQSAEPLHVAVVGGAGAGKSTVANLLSGTAQAESNPQAGFTRHPVAYTSTNAVLPWPVDAGFLGPLKRLAEAGPSNLDADVYQVRRIAGHQLRDVVTDGPGAAIVLMRRIERYQPEEVVDVGAIDGPECRGPVGRLVSLVGRAIEPQASIAVQHPAEIHRDVTPAGIDRDAIRLVAEVIVVVLATRPGRRWTRKQLIPEGGAVH